ncbi:MAG: tyrosine-type recombinase/integrase [Chloroflexi bacterium]|nr:tyrosine-type recombinase/integrase [Chloroflexota bacterium]
MDTSIENFLSSHPYAKTTKRTYSDILSHFIDSTDITSITAETLLAYIDSRAWGNARQCLALACITAFIKHTYGHAHPALNAKIKRTSGKLQRAITQEQLDQLLATFNRFTPKGARDLAIAAMLSQTGFRCAEICNLKQADTDTERGFGQVIAKGGQWRVGAFNPDTAAHIEHWKRYREGLQPKGGYLFVSLKSNYVGHKLTPEGLNRIIAKWGESINISLSPHDFRRGFATMTGENGGPDTLIMYGGGWSSQSSFNKYTRRAQLAALRKFLPNTTLEQVLPK